MSLHPSSNHLPEASEHKRRTNERGLSNAEDRYRIFTDTILEILNDLGRQPRASDFILDFGCGQGQIVNVLVRLGYERTVGCDIDRERIRQAQERDTEERLRPIELAPYRLPFDDGSVDLAISAQVLEHVEDLTAAFRELSRVMRPGAVGIHIFPPKFRILETHTHVPFGNIFRLLFWHRLWIHLGFRQHSTLEMSAADCARAHLKYIHERTFYRTEREINDKAELCNFSARFLSGIRYSKNLGYFRFLSQLWPVQHMYRILVSKVLVLTRL
jgi:SAM-dependent methyltransferase